MLRVLHSVTATAVAVATLSLGGAPAMAEATGSVTGTLFDQSDAPFAGGTVWLVHDCGTSCPETVADASGDYRFDGLTPGDGYCVAVNGPTDPEFCFDAVDGTVSAPDIQVGPTAPGVLRGTVTAVGGSPLAGASVVIDGRVITTDVSGGYQVTGLPPQDYTVTVSRMGYQAKIVDITVVGGTGNTLDLALSPKASTDQPPAGFITWSRNDGRLVAGGYAKDDVGVLKVRVAVRDQTTDAWLQPDGSWGDYRPLRAYAKAPGARRTVWKFKRFLPPGSYGVSLVVVDTALQRNPAPRPWLVVDVLP